MDHMDRVSDVLRAVEIEHNFRVIYACESGSRTHGLAGPDSDLDLRFVFVRPIQDYFRMSGHADSVQFESGSVDALGFDVLKAIRLLHRSNMTMIEWFTSPIVYESAPVMSNIHDLLDLAYDRLAVAKAHFGLAKTSSKELATQSAFDKPKLYAHLVRSIARCEWALQFESVPLTDFTELSLVTLPAEIHDDIRELARARRIEPRSSWKKLVSLPRVKTFIQDWVAAEKPFELPKREPTDSAQFDRLVKDAIMEMNDR